MKHVEEFNFVMMPKALPLMFMFRRSIFPVGKSCMEGLLSGCRCICGFIWFPFTVKVCRILTRMPFRVKEFWCYEVFWHSRACGLQHGAVRSMDVT